MAGRKSAEKVLRWRKIVKSQADSGLSVREFCATEGISEPSFYAWRKKLREEKFDRSQPPKVRRRKDALDNQGQFVPLKLLATTQALEIVHPLGYRIQVSGDVDPVALRNVIDALDERGDR
jgi:hypothetical protein